MKIKFLMIVLLCFLTTGCWDYRELNEMAIVTGMGIDMENENYVISLMVANTQVEAANDEAKTTILTGNGFSITEAMKDLELKIPDSIYLGHLSVLVIADTIAYHGMSDILNFVIKNYGINNGHYLVISKDNKAEDVLRVISPLDAFPSETIISSIKNITKNQGLSADIYFNDFVSTIVNQGVEGILPSVFVDGNITEETSEETETHDIPSLKIGPVGVFKNSKLLGWTTEDQIKGVNIINNNSRELFIILYYNDEKVIIGLTDLNCNKKVVFRYGIPEIDIEVSASGSIKEQSSFLNINSNIKEHITIESENELKYLVESAIAMSKNDYQSDILGLGNMIYKNNYKYWNSIKDDWDNELKNIKVNVNISMDLLFDSSLRSTIRGS